MLLLWRSGRLPPRRRGAVPDRRGQGVPRQAGEGRGPGPVHHGRLRGRPERGPPVARLRQDQPERRLVRHAHGPGLLAAASGDGAQRPARRRRPGGPVPPPAPCLRRPAGARPAARRVRLAARVPGRLPRHEGRPQGDQGADRQGRDRDRHQHAHGREAGGASGLGHGGRGHALPDVRPGGGEPAAPDPQGRPGRPRAARPDVDRAPAEPRRGPRHGYALLGHLRRGPAVHHGGDDPEGRPRGRSSATTASASRRPPARSGRGARCRRTPTS